MFETIKGIIGDLAAGSIKDQRIALSQEQLAALDLKLRNALTESDELRAENTRLAKRVTELEALVEDRTTQAKEFELNMGVLWKLQRMDSSRFHIATNVSTTPSSRTFAGRRFSCVLPGITLRFR